MGIFSFIRLSAKLPFLNNKKKTPVIISIVQAYPENADNQRRLARVRQRSHASSTIQIPSAVRISFGVDAKPMKTTSKQCLHAPRNVAVMQRPFLVGTISVFCVHFYFDYLSFLINIFTLCHENNFRLWVRILLCHRRFQSWGYWQ